MKLRYYPDPILTAPCLPITKEDDVASIIKEMTDIMLNNSGVGIALPQLGISKSLFIIKLDNNEIQPFLNPTVLESFGSIILKEGCLSFKGILLDIVRPEQITIEYDDLNFERQKAVLNGQEARIFLHELEHISQKTFLNNVSRQVKRNIIKDLEKKKLV